MLLFLILNVRIKAEGYIRMNSGILTNENYNELPDSLAKKYQQCDNNHGASSCRCKPGYWFVDGRCQDHPGSFCLYTEIMHLNDAFVFSQVTASSVHDHNWLTSHMFDNNLLTAWHSSTSTSHDLSPKLKLTVKGDKFLTGVVLTTRDTHGERYKSVCLRVNDATDFDNCTSTTFVAEASEKIIFMTKPIKPTSPTTIEIVWPAREGNFVKNSGEVAELDFVVCK